MNKFINFNYFKDLIKASKIQYIDTELINSVLYRNYWIFFIVSGYEYKFSWEESFYKYKNIVIISDGVQNNLDDIYIIRYK